MGSDSNGSDKVFEGLGIIQVQMPVPSVVYKFGHRMAMCFSDNDTLYNTKIGISGSKS